MKYMGETMSNQGDDYFEDNFHKVAEAYWNDDKAGDLALIGETVLNNPALFTAFLDVWGANPLNQKLVREWFDENQPDADIEDTDEGRDR